MAVRKLVKMQLPRRKKESKANQREKSTEDPATSIVDKEEDPAAAVTIWSLAVEVIFCCKNTYHLALVVCNRARKL